MLDTCYDRIPIMFERTTKNVDPINRQIYVFASAIHCSEEYTNVFQFHIENDKPWHHLLPDLIPFNKPLLFEPTELVHITQFLTLVTRHAGIYNPKQMKIF